MCSCDFLLLGLVPVTRATGEALFCLLKQTLADAGMDFKNCIGFGSDGAANMVGEQNSLFSRILKESPNCVLFKCICHSLALCVQKGCEKLPSAEIPSWFSNSALRRDEYKTLFKVLDTAEESSSASLPFQKMSATRWLVRGLLESFKRILCSSRANWNSSCQIQGCNST